MIEVVHKTDDPTQLYGDSLRKDRIVTTILIFSASYGVQYLIIVKRIKLGGGREGKGESKTERKGQRKEKNNNKKTCFVLWYQKYKHRTPVVREENKSTATKHANSGMRTTAGAAL